MIEHNWTPHKCPVCDGSGLVSRPPWIAGDVQVWGSSSCGPYTCPACNGAKVVWSCDCELDELRPYGADHIQP